MGTSQKRRTTSAQEYVSYLTQSECEEIMSEYLSKEFSAGAIKFDYRDGGKNRVGYKSGTGSRKTGTFYMNSCPTNPQYFVPVLIPFAHGQSESVSLKTMLNTVSKHWQDLSKERWVDANSATDGPQKTLSDAERKRIQQEIDEKNKVAQLEAAKKEYLSRLVGTAVSQYFYLTAKAQQNPAFHTNQTVREADKHPYVVNKKMQLNESDDFLILSTHVPSMKQLLKFIESEKFDLPKNDYNFKRADVAQKLTALQEADQFKINDYFSNFNIRDGIGIIRSHDIHGTTLNLQRIFLKKIDGVDKFNIYNAITHKAMHTFDMEQKVLNPDYQPRHIILTEGWATGKSINDATKHNPQNMVVVGWTANQLANVAEALLERYPNARLTIAADNDIKSFITAHEKDAGALAVVKNTGIEAAISTYQNSKHQDRISIITPDIPYDLDLRKGNKSDFDDIRMSYGQETLKQVLKDQLTAAADRIKNNVNEAEYYIDFYNKQADHFSKLHLLPIKGIGQKLGDVTFDPLDASVSLEERARLRSTQATQQQDAQAAVKAPVNATAEAEPELPPMNLLSFEGMMRVEVNEALKTEFDRNLELQISLIHRAEEGLHASTAQDQQYLHTVDDKRPIPLVDPALLTSLVYQNHLQQHLALYIDNSADRDEILQKLQQDQPKSDKSSRLLSAIIDPVMGEHIPQEIEKLLDQYVNSPIYQNLNEIKQIISENHITLSLQSQQLIQKTQAEITREVISNNYQIGVDDEITKAILDKDIINQDISTKQVFYKELRSCLRSLGHQDEAWLKNVKEVLHESQHLASAFSKPNQIAEKKDAGAEPPSP